MRAFAGEQAVTEKYPEYAEPAGPLVVLIRMILQHPACVTRMGHEEERSVQQSKADDVSAGFEAGHQEIKGVSPEAGQAPQHARSRVCWGWAGHRILAVGECAADDVGRASAWRCAQAASMVAPVGVSGAVRCSCRRPSSPPLIRCNCSVRFARARSVRLIWCDADDPSSVAG